MNSKPKLNTISIYTNKHHIFYVFKSLMKNQSLGFHGFYGLRTCVGIILGSHTSIAMNIRDLLGDRVYIDCQERSRSNKQLSSH